MVGSNLAIPDEICDELSYKQSKVYEQTDRQTDAGNDNTPLAWKDGVNIDHVIKRFNCDI